MSTVVNTTPTAPTARRAIIIEGDWTVAHLVTLADCDDALAILEDQAQGIEDQLADEDEESTRTEEWYGKAEKALSLKRIGIRQVKALRERLVADTAFDRFKTIVKAMDPALFERAISIASASSAAA